jgi:hypothetical protein
MGASSCVISASRRRTAVRSSPRRAWARRSIVCIVTVAVVVKVFDGMVLATDSATTFNLPTGGAQVYNTANKIFRRHRKWPVAAATWELGSIGDASISTLAKDLRRRFMGRDEDHPDWELDLDG